MIRTNDPCVAGRRAKRAKTDTASLLTQTNNRELRRLADAGAVPDWFPRIQGVWTQAVNHVSHLDLAPRGSPRRFALPPIHLFWGGEPPNQRIYYYHYLLLFNEIKNRPERDLPALTTQEWRSILGNTYWKKQWPTHDGNNLLAFDPNVFWKFGGSLLFGDDRSADVNAGRYNPTSRLACRCDVQSTTADDTDIRQVVLYYLNSYMYMRRSGRWNASSSRPISRNDGEVYFLSSTRLWKCGTHQGVLRSTPGFLATMCGKVGFWRYATL